MTREEFSQEIQDVEKHTPLSVLIENHSDKNKAVHLFDPQYKWLKQFDPAYEKGAIEIHTPVLTYDELCTGIKYDPEMVGLIYLHIYHLSTVPEQATFAHTLNCRIDRLQEGTFPPFPHEVSPSLTRQLFHPNYHQLTNLTFFQVEGQQQKHIFMSTYRFPLDQYTRLFIPALPPGSKIGFQLHFVKGTLLQPERKRGQWHPDLPPVLSIGCCNNNAHAQKISFFDEIDNLPAGVTFMPDDPAKDRPLLWPMDILESSVNEVGQTYLRITSSIDKSTLDTSPYATFTANVISKNKKGVRTTIPLLFKQIGRRGGKTFINNDPFLLTYLTTFQLIAPPFSCIAIDMYPEKSRTTKRPTDSSADH